MKHPWQRTLLGIALAVVILPAGTPSARADCPEVERELERVVDQLRHRQEQLDRCRVPHARGLIEQAERSLREAGKRSHLGQCRRAGLQVDAARGLLERADRLCAGTDSQQDQVLDFLNETDRLIEGALDSLEPLSPECRRLMQAAKEQQEDAWRRFRAKKQRFALNLSGGARRTADAALRCARDGGAPDGPGMPEHVLQDTDAWLEHVADMLDAPAPPALKQAHDLQKRAKSRARDGRLRLAVRLSLQARHMAVSVLADPEARIASEQVQGLLQAARDYVDEVSHMPGKGNSKRIQNLVRDAQRQLNEGEALLKAGNPTAALTAVRSGLALALKATEGQGPGGDR